MIFTLHLITQHWLYCIKTEFSEVKTYSNSDETLFINQVKLKVKYNYKFWSVFNYLNGQCNNYRDVFKDFYVAARSTVGIFKNHIDSNNSTVRWRQSY